MTLSTGLRIETAGKGGTRPKSIAVEHRDRRRANTLYLVPVPEIVMFSPATRLCNRCRVRHDVKTVHLDLDANGRALVSWGVYELLRKAGMPHLDVVGTVVTPPALVLSRNASRPAIDNANRRQSIWTGQPQGAHQ